LGTLWDLGNLMGTRWKQVEKKIPLPCPLKKEKTGWFIEACSAFSLAA